MFSTEFYDHVSHWWLAGFSARGMISHLLSKPWVKFMSILVIAKVCATVSPSRVICHADHCDSQGLQLSRTLVSLPPLAGIRKANPQGNFWVRPGLTLPHPWVWKLFSVSSVSSHAFLEVYKLFIRKFFYCFWLNLSLDILFSCCKCDSANNLFLSILSTSKHAINRLELNKYCCFRIYLLTQVKLRWWQRLPSLVTIVFIIQIKKVILKIFKN